MLNLKPEKGYSLVELLISTVISMTIIIGIINFYIITTEATTHTYKQNRLIQELRSVAYLMVRDIRRAGYWYATPGIDNIWSNPFTNTANDLIISSMSTENPSSCILYRYDLNSNHLVDDGEQFGFRLNSGTIEMHTGGVYSCNDAGGNWEPITTPGIEITNVTFDLDEVCLDINNKIEESCPCNIGDACQHIRTIDMVLEGATFYQNTLTFSLNEAVKIRNDKFVKSVSI